MSGKQNKCIFFYTEDPRDNISKECLEIINSTPSYSQMFIKICIHYPGDPTRPQTINLPKIILKLANMGKYPIVAVSGFPEPILGGDILSWLKGESGGSLVAVGNFSSSIADNCSTIEDTESVNNFVTGFNIGFSSGDNDIGKNWANINSDTRINTIREDEVKKQKLSSSELDMLKKQRDIDVPQKNVSLDGYNPYQFEKNNQQGGGMNGNLPTIPNYPQQPQQSQPQFPQQPHQPFPHHPQQPHQPFPHHPQQPQFPQQPQQPQQPQFPHHPQQPPQFPQQQQQPPQFPQQQQQPPQFPPHPQQPPQFPHHPQQPPQFPTQQQPQFPYRQ